MRYRARVIFVTVKRFVFNTINLFLSVISLRLINQKVVDMYIHFHGNTLQQPAYETTVQSVVFSKDRVMQLHAFLKSYEKNVGSNPLTVLFHYGETKHALAYVELSIMFPNIKFLLQRDFKDDLLSILNTGIAKTVLFVDDTIITKKICYEDYRYLDVYQTVSFHNSNNETGRYYPLGVTANMYFTRELVAMLRCLDFHSPNSLEGAMQHFMPYFAKREQRRFNPPLVKAFDVNKVQDEVKGQPDGFSADYMLKLWENGWRIDIEHTENGLIFIKK